MAYKLQLAVLLCGAALLLHATAQTTTDARWFVGVGGGVDGGEFAGSMANEGDRRFISGFFKGAGTEGKKEYNEFVWSDGTWSRQVSANNMFVAKVTSDQDIKWHRPPRRCYNDENGVRVCDDKDNFYFKWDGDSNRDDLWALGAGNGHAVALLKDQPMNNAYTFQQVDNDGWTTIISAEGTRIPKEGTSAVSPSSWGQTQNADGSLNLLKWNSTNGRFYALFEYTGNVRIGKTEYGKMGTTYIVRANGTYAQLSNVDRYDIDDDLCKVRPEYATSPLTNPGQYAQAWTARKGYLLLSLNIVTGNVEWVMPIWAQKSSGWNPLQLVASKYDHAVYLHYDTLKSRVVFGAPFKFDSNNYVLDNGFGSGATTVAPAIDNWSDNAKAGFGLIKSDYDAASKYKYLQRIDVDGNVKQPYKVLATDRAGGLLRSTPTPNGNSRSYSRTAGGEWVIGADDDSTKVFVATVFKQTTTSRPIIAPTGGDTMPKFCLASSGTVDYYTQQTSMDLTTYYYDSTDLFTAAFDGASLDTATSPLWVGQLMGWGDAPTVQFVSGSGKRMYVLGTFLNASYYGNAVMFAKSTSKADTYVLEVSGDDGTFVDAGTISSLNPITVKAFATSGERAYVYGTFSGQMSLDVLNTDRPGMTAHPRTQVGSAIFMATFSKDLAKSEGSEREPEDTTALRLGLGLGLGLGIPLLIAICVIVFMLMKGGGGGGGFGGGKVEPA